MKLINSFIGKCKYRSNPVVVKDYSLKNGAMREIVSEIGLGNKSVRRIYFDTKQSPQKVVDSLFGKKEIYLRDPQDFKSIIIESNGTQRHLKGKAIESLVDILA